MRKALFEIWFSRLLLYGVLSEERHVPYELKTYSVIHSSATWWENMFFAICEQKRRKLISTFVVRSLDSMSPAKRNCVFSIPSWQISTAHVQPFRGARDLVFCLKVPLDSLLIWASSEGSGETARMRRLAWTFAARIGDKYQIRLTRSV